MVKMIPEYPQLTIEELQIIISSALRQFYEEQRSWKIDNSRWTKLCQEIYFKTQDTGALFFDIIPNYETEREA